ncbi:MAG: glycosyltransferase [Bacteroidales bacterium]|nr:glycosyltransferase [Bacteroidales bacterium]
MTLSVLMSVYRKETGAHLDRSLKSVWDDQTRKPDQIVLVEDGPLTDELYAVIEKWRGVLGDKLCSPKNETNMGLTAALNKGLEHVTSDLVARNDSDDYSAPRRFELQVKYLEEHGDVDVLGGAMQEFDEEHLCLCIRRYPTHHLEKYICKASPCAHPTVVMRMHIFREGGVRYDDRYPLNEDIALWYDILRQGYSISNLQDVVYYFECSGGMFERRSRQKAWPEFKVYMRGIKDLRGVLTWRYVYPISRLVFRLMPVKMIAWIYGSKMRQKFLTKK